MITLYYIKGITRLDEPVFDTLEHQKAFFSSYKIAEVDTGFYPPHFQNQITISTDDASFDTSCNYLSLTYGTKTYYYFIDSITYVSEDVILLNVTMDTFQTYLFNLDIKEADVTRASIKRWISPDDKTINRQYNRENLTNAPMQTEVFSQSSDDIGWFLIWMRENQTLEVTAPELEDQWTPYDETVQAMFGRDYKTEVSFGNSVGRVYSRPLAIPVLMTGVASTINLVYKNASTNINRGRPLDIGPFTADPYVFKITFVAYDILDGYYTRSLSADGTLTLTFTGWGPVQVRYKDKQSMGAGVLMLPDKQVYHTEREINYLSGYKPNRSKTSILSPTFVPAVIDENYMEICWGEQMSLGTYPIHKLAKPELHAHCFVDHLTNTRVYLMSPSKTLNSIEDTYQTMTVCNSDESVDMYTDAYRDWESRNKGTLTTGLKRNYQNIAYQGGKRLYNSIMDMGTAVGSFAMGSYGTAMRTANEVIKDQTTLGPDIYMQVYNVQSALQEAKENYEYTPDVTKQGNEYTSDIIFGTMRKTLRIQTVADLAHVAEKLERYGYSVSYNSIGTNPITDYNYRYYYNVLVADLSSFTLTGVIADEATSTAIKSRFSAGLRLWNTDNGVLRARYLGDFKYDNVETDFIKE